MASTRRAPDWTSRGRSWSPVSTTSTERSESRRAHHLSLERCLCGREWFGDDTVSEDGQVGGIEAIAFGVLVLVLGVLIIGNAWGVIDARIAAGEAARERRTFATAPATTDAQADGLAWRGDGDLGPVRMDPSGDHDPTDVGVVRPVRVVTYEVSIPVPAIPLPWLASGLSLFPATATDSEQVDPYRSGVPGQGAADCTAESP